MLLQQLVEGKNLIKKGNAIFLEGEPNKCFGIILQGSFDVVVNSNNGVDVDCDEEADYSNGYTVFIANKSEFIGISGLSKSVNTFTYIAKEDSIVFIYMVDNEYELKEILLKQKEYSNYIINSLIQEVLKIDNNKSGLQTVYYNLMTFNKNINKFYDDFDKINNEYFVVDQYKNISIKKLDNNHQGITDNLKKPLMNADWDTSIYNIKKLSDTIIKSKDEFINLINSINDTMTYIFNSQEGCLFKKLVKLSNTLKVSGKSSETLLNILSDIVEYICSLTENLNQCFNTEIDIEIDKMKYLYKLAVDYKPEISQENILDTSKVSLNENGIPDELENSLIKILNYSGLPKDVCDQFTNAMDSFIVLSKNKEDENKLRDVKKIIEELFFDIYEQVLINTIKDDNTDKLYDMFLNYAYMDERLLSKEELVRLYCIGDNNQKSSLCNIYTMRQWLTAVYKGKKEPSVDDFDMDYYDHFRQLKKSGDITDKEKNNYYTDQNRKLKFEITHLFRRNQKLCFGHASTYFPILCSTSIVGDLYRAYASSQIINDTVKKILDIDFSCFHREVFCHDSERGLEKEYIMTAVAPDIITTPIFGSKGVMWQPISGRDKSNPARFILPTFTSDNIEDMLINVIGVFRWELCKTIMGVAWADVTQKSLTAEYSDYIQFYRKNNELSNEAKDKIKSQIVKSRNMLKSIFASDYEIWIKYEANGGIRLNKVVRAIMYNYCPFPKQIREKLELQGAFLEAATMFNRNRNKKIKELENKISKLSKTKLGVPKEINENLEFYKDR